MKRTFAILVLGFGLALPVAGCGRYGPPERSVEPPPRNTGASRGSLPASVPDVNEDETFQ